MTLPANTVLAAGSQLSAAPWRSQGQGGGAGAGTGAGGAVKPPQPPRRKGSSPWEDDDDFEDTSFAWQAGFGYPSPPAYTPGRVDGKPHDAPMFLRVWKECWTPELEEINASPRMDHLLLWLGDFALEGQPEKLIVYLNTDPVPTAAELAALRQWIERPGGRLELDALSAPPASGAED